MGLYPVIIVFAACSNRESPSDRALRGRLTDPCQTDELFDGPTCGERDSYDVGGIGSRYWYRLCC